MQNMETGFNPMLQTSTCISQIIFYRTQIVETCKLTTMNINHVHFLHFSGVSYQKRIEMNIKWITVLISKPFFRFNDIMCTGVEGKGVLPRYASPIRGLQI